MQLIQSESLETTPTVTTNLVVLPPVAALDFCRHIPRWYPTESTYQITADTMAIISQFNRTIILDRQRSLLQTPQTSRQLIQSYLKRQIIDFSQMRHLCHCLDQSRKVPLINGEYQFMPLSGPTHGNASWIALHYVTDFEQGTHQATFRLLNGTTLTVPYRGHQLAEEIHHCATLGRVIRTSLVLCANSFGYEIQLKTLYHASIIHRFDHCQCACSHLVPTTLEQLLHLLDNLENCRSEFIYHSAIYTYDDYDRDAFTWYLESVKKFLRNSRRL